MLKHKSHLWQRCINALCHATLLLFGHKLLTLYPIRCPLNEAWEGATQLIAIDVFVTLPPLSCLGASEGAKKIKQQWARKLKLLSTDIELPGKFSWSVYISPFCYSTSSKESSQRNTHSNVQYGGISVSIRKMFMTKYGNISKTWRILFIFQSNIQLTFFSGSCPVQRSIGPRSLLIHSR